MRHVEFWLVTIMNNPLIMQVYFELTGYIQFGMQLSNANRAFIFDPREWVQSLLTIQKNRQSLVGFYHSHPTTAPEPSHADREGMKYAPAASYWIVSLADTEHPVVQPYWFNGNAFIPLMSAQISV